MAARGHGRPRLRATPPSVPAIAVGDVGSTVKDADAARTLREVLREELDALDGARLVRSPEAAQYVVHGSVTRLTRRRVGGRTEARGAVSLVVADAPDGDVRVMLQGRALARGDLGARRLERRALRSAVHGALEPLPAWLKREHRGSSGGPPP